VAALAAAADGSAVAKAALEGDLAGKVADRLSAALARLGRAFMARDS
jgi:hypothetical protein